MGDPDERRSQRGGPPAERLREQLEREFGEVPPGTPLEEDAPVRSAGDEPDDDGDQDDREGGERPPDDGAEDAPEDDR